MILKNKIILLISPEPWSHLFVSKHHYAINLAERGNTVYFLNPPSPCKKISIQGTHYRNLYLINYNGFIRGLRFFPRFLQKRFIRKKFKEIEEASKIRFNIVWSFDNSVFYDFKALPTRVFSISHIVDLNQDFNTKKAAQTADLCIGVKQRIVDRLKRHNQNTILIPHGVQTCPVVLYKAYLPGKNKLKVVYIGNLDMVHLDWDLLFKLISGYSKIDFVLIGNNNANVRKKDTVLNLKNVAHIAPVPASKIPDYLNSADVLITLYDKKYAINYATPHKMMEYFASGKMIVATWTAEYEQQYKSGLILMAKSNQEFLAKFKLAIENLEYWNSTEKQLRRKSFALDNTYEKQISRIDFLLKTKDDLN